MRQCCKSFIRAVTISVAQIVVFIIPSAIWAQQGPAPSVQADLLRDKIYAQAKANDVEAVLTSLDEYRKLSIPFPTPLLWIEAKAARESGDSKRALEALTAYLNRTDHNPDQYKEGLALYPSYKKEAEGSTQLQTDSRRQALIARIPEVVTQLNNSVVSIPGGLATLPEDWNGSVDFPLFEKKHLGKTRNLKIQDFSLTRVPINYFWWDVFAADTGRPSYDDWKGDSQNLDFPVSFIQPQDVRAFAEWVSKHAGGHWQLPSEVELIWVALVTGDRKSALATSIEPIAGSYRYYDEVLKLDLPAYNREITGDCWHNSFGANPADGSSWELQCDDPTPLVLQAGPGDSLGSALFRSTKYSRYRFRYEVGGPYYRFHLVRSN